MLTRGKKILIGLGAAVSVGVGVWLVYELSNVSPKLFWKATL